MPPFTTATTGLPGSGVNWVDQLARHSRHIPEHPALVFEGRQITWHELHDRVLAVASTLREHGVAAGDRVAVLMSNRPEFLVAVLAANRLGAIAVPINFRLSADEVSFIVADSGSVVLATDQGLAPVAAKVRSGLGGSGTVLVAGDDPAAAGEGALSFDAAATRRPGPLPESRIDEHDAALIMYTSGTTGRPKGAVLSHLNIAVQSATMIRYWRLNRGDEISLCVSPLFHIAAIGMVAPVLATGATTVIMPSGRFDPEVALETVQAQGVTHVFMVPAQWQAVVDVPEAGALGAGLRAMSWGAAPATVSLLNRMAETFPGVPNICLFGQTEMSPVVTVLEGEDAVRKIGSVGKPTPWVSVRVVDDAMNDVPRGQVGEIVYRGPGLMGGGYWNRPEATAEACEGGWFHSGDLVREDEEGFLYVVDRKKDMIISGGENVYCAEVENVLAGHPSVADVAVIGVEDARWGETPLAVVVPVDREAPPVLADLVEWCAPRLASYKKPTRLAVVDALPRNASGKVLKPVLRQEFAASTAIAG